MRIQHGIAADLHTSLNGVLDPLSILTTQLKNTIVSARDVTAVGREQLAVANLPSGNYLVEISRASGGDSGPAVHGDVTLKLGNETYMRSADGLIMPAKKGQKPPDMRYFNADAAAKK